MVTHEQRYSVPLRIIGAVLLAALLARPAMSQQNAKKFYPDDPLLKEPPPRPVKTVASRNIDQLYDFLDNSFATSRREGKALKREPRIALNVNTLGDVPDSAWYTNRHYLKRTSLEELKRGPGDTTPPSPERPWHIIAAKSDGVMPGFVIEDKHKNRYLLKFDPPGYPELASAADVIGSKVFYALGYNTPENYIVRFHRADLAISDGVLWRDSSGKKHALTARILDDLLKPQAKGPDGAYRAMASRWIPGESIGPFFYRGTRSDDPNDIVNHERHRELRGLRMFAAWLNHTDAKSINTMDSLVNENGIKYVRHYLLDFGSILGSAGTSAKLPWYGHEYFISPKEAAVQVVSFGFYLHPWETSRYPKLTGAGLLDSRSLDPVSWKPDYPNPAFLMMDRLDAFWAAKQISAFTNADIRALVETGQFSDPRTTEWITTCLIERRDKIAAAWFSNMLPLDKFRISGGKLTFEDLTAPGAGNARQLAVRWASWDDNGHATPLRDARGFQISPFREDTQYLAATITAQNAANPDDPVTVYVRRGPTGLQVVGVDR